MTSSTTTPPDELFMQLALEEAILAAQSRDVPVGAIVVSEDGRVVARGRNRREADQDPTAHAELVALKRAAAERGHWRLNGATLYVTLEPCLMCAGAVVNARIKRVVYGCSDPKAGALQSLYAVGSDSRLNHRFEVRSGVLADACVLPLRQFFAELRAAGEK